MSDGDVVFLVPGLFGFNAFGKATADRIEYFDRVVRSYFTVLTGEGA